MKPIADHLTALTELLSKYNISEEDEKGVLLVVEDIAKDAVHEFKTNPETRVFAGYTIEHIVDINKYYNQKEAVFILEVLEGCEDTSWVNLLYCCEDYGIPDSVVEKLVEFVKEEFDFKLDEETADEFLRDQTEGVVLLSDSTIYDLIMNPLAVNRKKKLRVLCLTKLGEYMTPIQYLKFIKEENLDELNNEA